MTLGVEHRANFEDDVIDRLARIETAASMNAATAASALNAVTTGHTDHEGRLRILESGQAKVLSYASVIAILSGFLTDIAYNILKGHMS